MSRMKDLLIHLEKQHTQPIGAPMSRFNTPHHLCSDFQNTVSELPDFDGEGFKPPANLFRVIPQPVVTHLPEAFGMQMFLNLQRVHANQE